MQLVKKALVVVVLSCFGCRVVADYSERPEIQAMANRLAAKGLDRNEVIQTMRDAKRLESVIEAISRPAENKQWKDYRSIFIKTARINAARNFFRMHEETLNRAEKEFGVPTSIILAIIGVETYYGKHKGKFRALDALATLGLDYPRRSKFFMGELESLFLLGKAENFNPESLVGSYAGALGFGQFIPSVTSLTPSISMMMVVGI